MNPIDKITSLIEYLNEYHPYWKELSNIETFNMMFSSLSEEEENLLSVIIILNKNETAWSVPHVFENVVDCLNGNPIIPGIMTKPPLQDIMYAVDIMDAVNKQEFSPAICYYIAAIGVDSGLLWLPPKLEFAQPFMKSVFITMGSINSETLEKEEQEIILNDHYDEGLIGMIEAIHNDDSDIDDEDLDNDVIKNQLNKLSLIYRLYKLKSVNNL